MRGPAPHARSPQAPRRPRGSSGGIRSAPHRLAEADSTSRSPLLKSWAISARRTGSATGRSRLEEIKALLAAPDRRSWHGRRDHALLLVAIQTGLRVSELTGL